MKKWFYKISGFIKEATQNKWSKARRNQCNITEKNIPIIQKNAIQTKCNKKAQKSPKM
jgi:hypothetical protein